MAYFINDDCINCGACASVCPRQCIKQDVKKHVIDREECISCGSCAGVCPVGAPNPESE